VTMNGPIMNVQTARSLALGTNNRELVDKQFRMLQKLFRSCISRLTLALLNPIRFDLEPNRERNES
ncbi:MAG: hypothetical protein WCG75_08510, partial [Armatimonadota bacterium]